MSDFYRREPLTFAEIEAQYAEVQSLRSEGMTVKAMAEMLGVSTNTISKRFARGKHLEAVRAGTEEPENWYEEQETPAARKGLEQADAAIRSAHIRKAREDAEAAAFSEALWSAFDALETP